MIKDLKYFGTFLVAQIVKSMLAMWETRLISGLGRSSGEENGYPLQYSCLENSMDRGVDRLHSIGSVHRELGMTE